MRSLTVAVGLVLVLSTGAAAATPTDTLRAVFSRAEGILTDPGTEDRPLDRLAAVRKLISDALDFREAAALALPRHWSVATPPEQREFTGLLADMIERFYLARLASQASLEGGPQIRYVDESVAAGEALVRTSVARRNGGEISLGYRMIERDGRWKVRDVIVDGVSIAANYRAQIERVLEAASVAELLGQMRDKTAEPAPSAETSAPVLTAAEEEASAPEALTEPVAEPAVEPAAEPMAAEPAPVTPPIEEPPVVVVSLPSRPATAVTKAYWLRLGTVEAIEASGRLHSLLDERKLVVAVEPAAGDRRAVAVNLRLGPFDDATEAVLKLLELQGKGHDPSLVAEHE